MAGKQVRNYLKARGFDAFYDLYHGLSERIFSPASTSIGYLAVVTGSCMENPAIQSDKSARAALDAQLKLAQETASSLRHFFWDPSYDQVGDFNLRRELCMQRWEPFDEAAWDSFFPQMAAVIQSSVRVFRDCREKIETQLAGQAGMPRHVPDLLTLLETKCTELLRFCDQSWVEFDIFHNYFLARLRQDVYGLASAVAGIERDIEEEAIALKAEFRAELEAFAVMVRQFRTLLETFRSIEAIERMLLDRELLAGSQLPRDEAAWDAVSLEMSKILELFAGKMREHLSKLRAYSSKPSPTAEKFSEAFDRMEKFLNDSSHIFLEMAGRVTIEWPAGQS